MRAAEIAALTVGPAVLDVGCAGHDVRIGEPDWLHGLLRARFDDVTGIDLDEVAVDKMRAAGIDDLHVVSAESFEFDRRFDTIVAGELIEHLSNPGRFLDRAVEHLAPGGRIVLSTPWLFSLHYVAYGLWKYPRTCENPEHTMWFCPATLGELAARSGLRIARLDLVSDYDLASPAPVYRRAARALLAVRRFVPARLVHNTMLAVLEPEAPHPS